MTFQGADGTFDIQSHRELLPSSANENGIEFLAVRLLLTFGHSKQLILTL